MSLTQRTARADRLTGVLPDAQVDVLLVTDLVNVRYLTGYTGSNGLAVIGPETRAFIRSRRSTSEPPGEAVADFEEYTRLYQESWSEPTIRWLLSTLPSAMIFDDHEIVDDWNTSESWKRDMVARPWWNERIAGGLMSYWIYQHIGNLSPAELREDGLYARVQQAEDAGPLLKEFALRADRTTDGTRWSYARRLGPATLVVVDSRAGEH